MVTFDWRSIGSIGSVEEYEVFDRITSIYHQHLKRDLLSLEIGSYQGQSAVLLAQYGRVISLDLWGDIFDGMAHLEQVGQVNFAPFIQTIIRFDLIGKVIPIVATSECLPLFPGTIFDLIYIDGSHYYDPVRADITNSVPHLALGGLLVFHDYKREGGNPNLGVNIAVDELLLAGNFAVREHFKGLLCLERIGI